MEENKTVVLEGMYNGVAGKIDEVRKTVSKELQFNSAQQVTAYEAISDEIQESVNAVLSELRYLSEQNSTIYDAMMSQINAQLAELSAKLESRAAAGDGNVDYDVLADKVVERMRATRRTVKKTTEDEELEDDGIDYDILAEKIMSVLPEDPDFDELVERVVAAIPKVDEERIANKVLELMPQAQMGETGTVEQHIVYNNPDVDYDEIVRRVVEAMPKVDEQAIAERVIEWIPQGGEEGAPAEQHIHYTAHEPDYEVIAQKVAAAIEQDDTVHISPDSVEQIAQRVVELLRADEGDIERIVREVVVVPTSAPVEEPAPQEEPEKTEEIAAAEEAPVVIVEEKPAPAPVIIVEQAPAPAPVVVTEEPVETTTRYKRSFVAKIIESEEEIKTYYSDMKNVILSYAKVRSQINWTNDRFYLGQESIIKIGMRGKTLCVYLALDCNEFPESVYHQTFAGDTKMYEKTPMMVKVKSGVAAKRAIRLIELLLERLGAVKEDHAHVDYAAQYFFRTEEELLAEGLIKTATVEKSDLKF